MGRYPDWSAAAVEATEEGLVLTVPLEGDPNPDWDDASTERWKLTATKCGALSGAMSGTGQTTFASSR